MKAICELEFNEMLTPRRSSVWSFILLCLEKLSQKCLLVNWRYFGISSKNEEQILDILIIFVRKLYFVNFVKPLKPQSVFKKYIWVHFTLHCEHVGESHETILSITGSDIEPLHLRRSPCVNSLQLSAVNNCRKELHPRYCSTKAILYIFCFCFKWFLQNIAYVF